MTWMGDIKGGLVNKTPPNLLHCSSRGARPQQILPIIIETTDHRKDPCTGTSLPSTHLLMFYPNYKPLPLPEAQHMFHLMQFHPTFHQPHGYMHAYMHAGGWRRHPQVSCRLPTPALRITIIARADALVLKYGHPTLSWWRRSRQSDYANNDAWRVDDALIKRWKAKEDLCM
jgi:hypothetical protein